MDDIPSWLSVLLLFLFLAMSAFYSSAETAFSNVNKYKYKALADEGNRRAKLILWLADHFESTLVTVLIGYNVFAILISTFSTFLFMRWLSPYINETALSFLISIGMAIITFLFGDTIPKFLGKRRPESIAAFCAYPLAFFVILFFPVSFLFSKLGLASASYLTVTKKWNSRKKISLPRSISPKNRGYSRKMNPISSRPPSISPIPKSKRSSPRKRG